MSAQKSKVKSHSSDFIQKKTMQYFFNPLLPSTLPDMLPEMTQENIF